MTVDCERLVSGWLRARPEISAIVDDRVVTEMPNRAVFPLLRLTLIGGAPVFSTPLYLDQAVLQFDAYGGPKVVARSLIDAVRAALATDLSGTQPAGVVTGVRFHELLYQPDVEYDPPKPRYVSSASIYTHP